MRVAGGTSTDVTMLSSSSPKRIAAAIAFVLAAGAAGSSWAAGLGRLTVQSALGQPLVAEVEVSSLTPAEAASLTARLAPVEAFRQAGLQFNPALSQLRFSIERRPNGQSVVRITSPQAINEPFVDLLVELNWAGGRFVREYTFLLDPPELRSAASQTVDGGNVIRNDLLTPSAAPALAARPPVPSPAPAAAALQTPPAAPAPAPAPARAPAERRAEAAPAQPAALPRPSAAPSPAALQVRPGDTLAGIAARVKPASVSLDQALIALYQANPEAFFGGVHRLRAGAQLSIPDAAAMAAVDAGSARQQIRAHTRDFNAYRARLAENTRTVASADAGQAAEGRIGARVEDQRAPTATGDQLRLSRGTPDGAATGGGSAGTAATRQAEQTVARDAASREAQSRVADLEKNLADLQQLLELKNRQLAELQRQVERSQTAGQSVGGAIPSGAGAALPAPAAAGQAAGTLESAQAGAAARAGAAGDAGTGDAGAAAGAQAEGAQGQPAQAQTPAAASEAPKPAAPKPKPTPAPAKPPPSFLDELMANPLLLPGLGGVLVLLLGYGWYALRRKRKAEQFEDSLIAADGFASNSLFGATGGQTVDTAESGLFTPTATDTGVDVHSAEVDPIAEAEVYIAYGREVQAEEILREALKKQPERQAIRAKLLEILAGRKDVPAFTELAAEMHAQTGGRNEEWPKVVAQGLAIDPANPLYAGAQPVVPGRNAAQDASLRPSVAESPFGSGAAPAAAGVAAGTIATAGALAAAQASSTPRPRESSPAAVSPASGPSGAELLASAKGPLERAEVPAVDFSVLESPAPAPAAETRAPAGESAVQAAAARPAEPDVPALDFDLDLDSLIDESSKGAAPSGSAAAPASDTAGTGSALEQAVAGRFELPSLELDIPGLGEAPSASPSAPATSPQSPASSLDMPALDLPSSAGAGSDGVGEGDVAMIGLDLEPVQSAPAAGGGARWQEMSTKLDLAAAYEEIGDQDGARELLEEVVQGGDAEQQQKARAMLARLN